MTDPNSYSRAYAIEYLYPYPLADSYRRYRTSRTAGDRVGYAYYASEILLKFLVATALPVSGTEPPPASAKLQTSLARAPTFGGWIDILREVVRLIDSSADGFPAAELRDCVNGKGRSDRGLLGVMDKLVEIRNRHFHGGPIINASAEIVLKDVETLYVDAMERASFLARTHLAYCEEVYRRRSPSCYEAILRLCKGANPVFPFEQWRFNEPIDPGIAYLVSPDFARGVPLSPIVGVLKDERKGDPLFAFLTSHHKWGRFGTLQESSVPGDESLREDATALAEGSFKGKILHFRYYRDKSPNWTSSLTLPRTWCPPHYSVVGPEALGRFADVYQVVDGRLQTLRAMKVMRAEVGQEPRLRRRFEDEIAALTRLRNLHVAADLVDFGETPTGLPYLIIEFVEGGSLLAKMQRSGPLDTQELLKIGMQLFEKLSVIHAQGILHRDIKLANILIHEDELRYCDFGSEKNVDDQREFTQEGDAVGTIGYIAPESRAGVWDHRSDIYALGVCLTNLLAGREDAAPRRWLVENFNSDPPLRDALLEMLEDIPANRPVSASAVAERLSGIALRRHKREGDEEPSISSDSIKAFASEKQVEHARWLSPDGSIFRRIPPGRFLMGGTRYGDEKPVHEVIFLHPFFLCTTLVTNSQFREFLRATKYRGLHKNFLLHLKDHFPDRLWRRDNSPVVFVTWEDANEYALWRSEMEGRDYRLPTEAQWEYACRAHTRTVYHWGNSYDGSKLNADNIHGHPTVVGAYPPNPWGLYDMLGNVWEWCLDYKDVVPREESLFYRQCADRTDACVDPANVGERALVSQRMHAGVRVVRGGSFHSEGRNFRPANRRGQHERDAVRSIGFRLAVYGIHDSETEQLS